MDTRICHLNDSGQHYGLRKLAGDVIISVVCTPDFTVRLVVLNMEFSDTCKYMHKIHMANSDPDVSWGFWGKSSSPAFTHSDEKSNKVALKVSILCKTYLKSVPASTTPYTGLVY